MSKIIDFGFWYSDYEPHLPKAKVTSEEYIDGFVEKIKKWKNLRQQITEVEANHLSIYDDIWTAYLGYSNCRLCNKDNNGDSEYIYGGYRFPEGITHYILDHHIEVPLEFQKMIVEKTVLDVNSLKTKTFAQLRDENILKVASGMANIKFSI